MDRRRRVIGIDYSMTSPAVVILDDTKTFANAQVYFLTDKKKFEGRFKNIVGDPHSPYKSQVERFHNISEWVLDRVLPTKNDIVYIEDYSMGSKGLIFNIAENTGILKHKLFTLDVRFVPIPPTTIKKFAFGSGRADKDQMYEAFLKENNEDLRKLLDDKRPKVSNPISDIVDAYFVAKCGDEENYEAKGREG